MTRRILTAALMAALMASLGGLAACDRGKPRHLPPDPMAITPTEPAPVEAMPGSQSVGLSKRPEQAGFFLDQIGAAIDPRGRPPALTPVSQPLLLDGFAFDPVAKTPGKGVDLVVDDKAYGAAYGRRRPDVATYFKTPSMADVGFTTTLPPGTLAVGPHVVTVRVIAADGKSYFASPAVHFAVTADAAAATLKSPAPIPK